MGRTKKIFGRDEEYASDGGRAGGCAWEECDEIAWTVIKRGT